jgi:hypothetical protein
VGSWWTSSERSVIAGDADAVATGAVVGVGVGTRVGVGTGDDVGVEMGRQCAQLAAVGDALAPDDEFTCGEGKDSGASQLVASSTKTNNAGRNRCIR